MSASVRWHHRDVPLTDGPAPEDYILSDTGPLGSMTAVSVLEGRSVGNFPSEDEALRAIRAKMEAESYWPNVWRMDDHGGINGPLDIGGAS